MQLRFNRFVPAMTVALGLLTATVAFAAQNAQPPKPSPSSQPTTAPAAAQPHAQPATPAAPGQAASPPNVIILVLECVRDDYVGRKWEGLPLTPNVDAIQAEGTRFTSAYSSAPWTIPAHASLFTGLYPHSHHADHARRMLDDASVTLAERLQARGYDTGGFTCNPWLGTQRGYDQGFGRFYRLYDEKKTKETAGNASTQAISWIRQRTDGRPFFLFVNYLEAHLPYAPPLNTLLKLRAVPGATPRNEFSVSDSERYINTPDQFAPADIKEAQRLYAAEVLYQDEQVGILLKYLREAGWLDKSLLFILADHGAHLGDHQLFGHEFSLYDETLHIPLIVRYPGMFPAGLKATAPVSIVDILPTVIDIAGLEPRHETLPGKSLRASLKDADPNRALLAEYSQPDDLINGYWKSQYPKADLSGFNTSLDSVRVGPWKLVVTAAGIPRLYNLADDPGETQSVAAQHADRVAELQARLKELEAAP